MAGTEDGGMGHAADVELQELTRAKEHLGEARQGLKDAAREVRTARRRLRASREHPLRNRMLFATGVALVVLFNPATGRSTRRWLSGKAARDAGDGAAP
jgi:hypothetical protein